MLPTRLPCPFFCSSKAKIPAKAGGPVEVPPVTLSEESELRKVPFAHVVTPLVPAGVQNSSPSVLGDAVKAMSGTSGSHRLAHPVRFASSVS